MINLAPRTEEFKQRRLNELYESYSRLAAIMRRKRHEKNTGTIEAEQNEMRIISVIEKDLKSEPYFMNNDDINAALDLIREQRRNKV